MIGITFDLEGTIIDVESAHHQGHLATARELGMALSYETAIAEIPAFIGGPDSAIAEALRQRSGSALSSEVISARMKTHYHVMLETMDIAPRAGFLAFFAQLRALGIPVTIGSVTPRDEAEYLLQQAGMIEYFDLALCVFAEDVAQPKPAPDVYLMTAERLGVLPRQQLVFEDSARGVQAAIAAGSWAIGIPTIHTTEFYARIYAAGARAIYGAWGDVPLDLVVQR